MAWNSNIIWNTKSISDVLDKMRYGAPCDYSCFHERDSELKAGNILFQLTQEEEEEYYKCATDVVYFVETYCKFLTDYGRVLVSLRDFQKEILHVLGEQQWDNTIENYIPVVRNYILMASRQSSKTTTMAAFFTWYLTFSVEKNAAVLANKDKTATEIISKITYVIKGLPFFLKPGIIGINDHGIRLDNGSQLMSQATTKTAQIGFTIHLLYMDEFAHIQPNIARDFWRSVYPTLSSSNLSQCIITSTPNGQENLFFELWDKAVKGENSFVHKRVDWWEVPGHDEAWAEKMKRDFGEDYFAQEFELKFDIASNTLLSGNQLSLIKRCNIPYNFLELSKSDLDHELYHNLKWAQQFDPDKVWEPWESFVLSIDIGEGQDEDEHKDSDSNICNIFQIVPKSLAQLRKLRKDQYQIQNMFKLVQVGLYKDNIKDEENCALVTKELVFNQFGEERCLVLAEMNFNGKNFVNIFKKHDNYFEDILVKTYHTKPVPGEEPRKKIGYKTTAGNKDYFCKLGRKLIKEKTIVITNSETYEEFTAFGKNKKTGTWKGLGKHDDTVMSTLALSRLFEEEQYYIFLEEMLEKMLQSKVKQKILELLDKVETESDMSDDTFNVLFSDTEKIKENIDVINKTFLNNKSYNYGSVLNKRF